MERFTKSAMSIVVCAFLFAGVSYSAQQATPTKSVQVAASQGDIEQLNLHIARGTDLDESDKNRMTALTRAIQSARIEAVKLLVGAGADVDKACFLGSPLMLAAQRMQVEIVKFLADEGADVNATGNSGRTALIVAAELGQMEIVELLVAKGADVNARDNGGLTPLTAARRFPDVADFLREKGAQAPVNEYGMDPYGRRGMGGGMGPGGGQDYRSMQEEPDILADPNALRAKIAALPGLAEGLKALDVKAASEERSWASRRSDNRTLLIRSVGKQFGAELAFVKGLATAEKAEKTIAAVDALAAKRTERYEVIAKDLREVRRLALQEARDMAGAGAGRGRGRGASRGRGMQGAGQGYGQSAEMGYGDPYGGPAAGRPGGRGARGGRATEDVVEEAPLDPDTAMQLDAWLGANPEDKRNLLASVHGLDLFELEDVRQIAVEEEASKTTAGIEGLMLAREVRVERITAAMAAEDARLERLAERAAMRGTTRGGRGRGGLQPEQPQGQGTVPSRRGRRGR